MSVEDEINRTKSRIMDHRADIRNLESHGQRLALKLLGLEIGDRIIVTDRGKDTEVVVSGVRNWGNNPAPIGMIVKKDGNPGMTSKQFIYSWRKKGAGAT